MTSSSEELFELRRERLRIDHVRLARDDPTFRLRDARGDRDCRFLEEVTSAAPVIVVAVKCFASFEASGAFSARSTVARRRWLGCPMSREDLKR